MKKAKRYWNRVMLRFDHGQKKANLRKWKEMANLKKIWDLA